MSGREIHNWWALFILIPVFFTSSAGTQPFGRGGQPKRSASSWADSGGSASVGWVARASGVITREDDMWQEVYWWFWSGIAFIMSVSYFWLAANTCQTLYGNLVCP
jgi:hypothetical protein